MITSASKLAEVKTTRCGVIPYTLVEQDGNDTIYFLLARDRPTRELGDFGGGVRKSEFSLMAGLREGNEETRGIFCTALKSANNVCNNLAVIDGNKMAVIFVPIERKWLEDAPRLFLEKDSNKKSANEVCEIVWVDEDKFKALIHKKSTPFDGIYDERHDIMWKKVRNFFSGIYKTKGFSETLKKIAHISGI
jgi:hypothetical protein